MTVLQRSTQHVVKQIQPGLWQIVFHFPATTNCWLWQESDGLTLVDAGHPWNTKAILDAIKCVGHPLRRIVITHAHPDHAGAAAEISAETRAVVLAHTADIPFLQGGCMSDVPGFWLCRAILKTGRCLGILNPPPITGVEPLVDGEMVGRLQVLHTPGHTPGSISLWAEEEKAVFCGDNIGYSFSTLHVGMPWFTLDLLAQKASLSRYASLPVQLLLSGHGPVYRGDVAHQVRKLLAV
jgi:glyoxylase-like metal-dependent hydrolase (beta-lactamase superfamily II)